MSEPVVVAPTAERRRSSSAVKSRDDIKKRVALWKKQIKCFKLKDVGKKVDAVRFCVQDDRFFREQPEVLPQLMGFLTRTKTPELVLETLSVFHSLLSPQAQPVPDAVGSADANDIIHPELNAGFMVERSTSADSGWKAGEPFINLFSASALSPDIRTKAVEVYKLLLLASAAKSAAGGETASLLLQFQSVGNPCSALLDCLGVDNNEKLQYAALSCLRDLLKISPDEASLGKFEANNGLSKTLEFISHSERCYHRPALDILDNYSHSEFGRNHLRKNGAAIVLCRAIQEAQQTIQNTATSVLSGGVDASPLSAKDAPLFCSNITTICKVFARITLAKDQLSATEDGVEQDALFTDAIDAMVDILRYDVRSALTPVVAPTETPRATGGGAAAAAAAAANAAALNAFALASLLPFSSNRCVAVISSLGRMVEQSERCKVHMKAQGVLPILLDCFKVQQEDQLHQVADKLLHLCAFIRDTPQQTSATPPAPSINGVDNTEEEHQQQNTLPPGGSSHIDTNILCAIQVDATGTSTELADTAGLNNDEAKPPLVSVEALLSLLEASHAAGDKRQIFRLARWIAALVDLPGNANALGERAVTLCLQILADSTPIDKLLFAFLAKCIRAIALQNAGALELCGNGSFDPSTLLFEFLQQKTAEVEPSGETPTSLPLEEEKTQSPEGELPNTDQTDDSNRDKNEQSVEAFGESFGCGTITSICKLEWADEYAEPATFPPKPLTEACHDVDVFLLVSDALAGLTDAYLKWNSATNAAITTDFSEILAAKQESDQGKANVPPPTGNSKKKPQSDQPKSSATGEAIMMYILEKGMLVLKLISQYTGVNAAVCVSLLGLLNNLMTVPSGLKVLLHLAKGELNVEADAIGDHTDASASLADQGTRKDWPNSVEQCERMEQTRLLLPVMKVLQSPQTTFIEIQAAVRSISIMTSDLDPTDKEAPAPQPEPVVEAPKATGKGAQGNAAAVPVPAPTIPELTISESDRFINAALGCGALVLLLSFLDLARIPTSSENLAERVKMLQPQIEEMVQRFIMLAQVKQEDIVVKYREKVEIHVTQYPDAVVPTAADDLNLPYTARWSQLLLDHKFNVSRFGYSSYPALLLAAELALPNLVRTLINVGACSNTASSDGMAPLMVAFLSGNEEIIDILLTSQANIDAITTDDRDLSVWNCAMLSPLGLTIGDMISNAYSTCEHTSGVLSIDSLIQLDNIRGSPQLLQLCLKAGMDVNVSSLHGDFPLHALLSKFSVRRKLRGLDLCFRYNSKDEDKERLESLVTTLINTHSADVNGCNHMGQTPLHLAILFGHTDVVSLLLLNGANPNVQDQHGQLPLHYACLAFCGKSDGSDGEAVEVVKLLLENAAKYPCTIGVHSDSRKHKSDEEKQALAIEDILECGLQSVIQPEAITQKLGTAQQLLETPSLSGGFLPWQFACGGYVQLPAALCLDDDMQKQFESNGEARASVLRYLLDEWRIDIGVCSSDGMTGLHLATKSDVNGNNIAIINTLLESNNPPADDTYRYSSLNINAVHEHILIDDLPVIPDGAKVFFIEPGCDGKLGYVSSRSLCGKYHLILADGQHFDGVERDRLEVIHDCGKTHSHHSHHYKYLLPVEYKFSALHYALQANHDMLALKLLSLPEISLDPEGSDLPLLALACAAHQSPEVVGQLITQQANMRVHLPLRTTKCELTSVDLSTSSSIAHRKHAAALHYAVMYDDFAMVKVLLANTGNHVRVNVRRSGDGFTPLHLACEMENMKIIKLLLDHGASLVQLSSMSANAVAPLQLLMKHDSLENEKLKELISDKYLRAEMLLDAYTGVHMLTPRRNSATKAELDSNQNDHEEPCVKGEDSSPDLNSTDGDDDRDVPYCILLQEERHNLDLFERFHSVDRGRRGSHEELIRRVESELKKGDDALRSLFDLLQQSLKESEAKSQMTDLKRVSLTDTFQNLRHPHECYQQFTVRSQWDSQKTVVQAGSKAKLHDMSADSAFE